MSNHFALREEIKKVISNYFESEKEKTVQKAVADVMSEKKSFEKANKEILVETYAEIMTALQFEYANALMALGKIKGFPLDHLLRFYDANVLKLRDVLVKEYEKKDI